MTELVSAMLRPLGLTLEMLATVALTHPPALTTWMPKQEGWVGYSTIALKREREEKRERQREREEGSKRQREKER